MKKIIAKKIFYFFSIICALVVANAQVPQGYKAFYIPSMLDATSQNDTHKTETYYALLMKKVDDENALIDRVKELSQADSENLKSLLVSQKDEKKAAKFLKMANLKEIFSLDRNQFECAKIGKFYLVKFPLTKKMRKGLNFLVFEKLNGKFLWNPSFNDPIFTLITHSKTLSNSADESINASPISENDAKILEQLKANDLPFIVFANGALVSLEKDNDVNDYFASKFYRNAQNFFYQGNLAEYAKFLSPESKKRFDTQFATMTKDQQLKALKDYFEWTKDYQKVMRTGKKCASKEMIENQPDCFDIVFFSRNKQGQQSQNDMAFIADDKGKVVQANWGANKIPLESFLGRYLLKDGDYLKAISEKFAK